MFLSGACADRILKTGLPDVTLSSMGLMDLNNGIESFLTRLTNNIAPLVEFNAKEVELALPNFLPENLIEKAKTAAEAAVKAFSDAGKHITKGADADFPLNDLLSRLREKYHAVTINENAVIYMAQCVEVAVAEFLGAAGQRCKSQGRSQITRNDIKWALANNYEIGPYFQE